MFIGNRLITTFMLRKCRFVVLWQTKSNLFFVMELITGGDLMFHVLKEGNMPERATNFYAAEVCCGLWFLHDRGILYRDLKLGDP